MPNRLVQRIAPDVREKLFEYLGLTPMDLFSFVGFAESGKTEFLAISQSATPLRWPLPSAPEAAHASCSLILAKVH
ncbi:hypothetical protein IMZ48_46325 [Candidatus Bathyarchaeota archaeon]|nr:hypothetical protein [Candidatus Bathyarchaeota archaeon]